MKKSILILTSVVLTLFFSCSKSDDIEPVNPNNSLSGLTYPYFTVDQDTSGGIANKEAGVYATVTSIVGVCPSQTKHKLKIQKLKITDTI